MESTAPIDTNVCFPSVQFWCSSCFIPGWVYVLQGSNKQKDSQTDPPEDRAQNSYRPSNTGQSSPILTVPCIYRMSKSFLTRDIQKGLHACTHAMHWSHLNPHISAGTFQKYPHSPEWLCTKSQCSHRNGILSFPWQSMEWVSVVCQVVHICLSSINDTCATRKSHWWCTSRDIHIHWFPFSCRVHSWWRGCVSFESGGAIVRRVKDIRGRLTDRVVWIPSWDVGARSGSFQCPLCHRVSRGKCQRGISHHGRNTKPETFSSRDLRQLTEYGSIY